MTSKECFRIIRERNAERGRQNRLNGEQFEFRVMREFKKRSDVMFVIRSAGSHSSIDIVVQFKNKKQYWITCKRDGYLTPFERVAIDKLKEKKPDTVVIKLAYYKSAKKKAFKKL